MNEVAAIVMKLTPAQIRLLKALRPSPLEPGWFMYPTGRGMRHGLLSGWALARRGMVERDPAMPGRFQQSETRTRGYIRLTRLGRRVHAEVARANL
jgi:hypothetical protein